VEAMRNGGAHILYPAPAPKSDTLKTDGIGMKEAACEITLPNAVGSSNIGSSRVQLGHPGVLRRV
jgi:hypothetical protein